MRLLVVLPLMLGCQLPVVSARSLIAQATQNELAAVERTRRASVEVSETVADISAGQSGRLLTAQNEGQLVTTLSVLRKPFVTFEVDGVRVIASLSDEDHGGAAVLKTGAPGVLRCRFGHFDRNGAGGLIVVLEYCRVPSGR